VVLDGRQQHHPPGTEVSVAGQRAGMLEPEDQGRTHGVPKITEIGVKAGSGMRR